MKNISIIAFIFIFPNYVLAGECEKTTAREAVVCLENKIISLNRNVQKLNNRISSLVNSKSFVVGNPSTVNILKNLPKPKVTASTTSNAFKFDIINCNRSSDSVNCNLIVTNRKADSTFLISNKSRAFNEFGEEFKIGNVKIVNKIEDLGSISSVGHRIIKNVPIKVEIQFTEISDQSTQFTAIDLVAYRGRIRNSSSNNALAKFRNISFIQ